MSIVPSISDHEILPVDEGLFTQINNASIEFMENFKEVFPSLILTCPGKVDGKE